MAPSGSRVSVSQLACLEFLQSHLLALSRGSLGLLLPSPEPQAGTPGQSFSAETVSQFLRVHPEAMEFGFIVIPPPGISLWLCLCGVEYPFMRFQWFLCFDDDDFFISGDFGGGGVRRE